MNVLDYRTRTGVERREKMRSHLITTALPLLAERGLGSNVIDEVVRAAGVSRGTFYNYFRSPEALFEAVATHVSHELISQVDPVLMAHPDPATRVASGVRLCLLAGIHNPLVAAFISRGGYTALHSNALLTTCLMRDLAEGIASGHFACDDLRLAYDLVVGPVMAIYHRMAMGETLSTDFIDSLAGSVLLALGVSKRQAQKLSRLPLQPGSATLPVIEITPQTGHTRRTRT